MQDQTKQLNSPLGDDLLIGAEAIAEYLFGDPKFRRRVYHLVRKGALPTFKYGDTLCARRSTLLKDVAHREQAVTA